MLPYTSVIADKSEKRRFFWGGGRILSLQRVLSGIETKSGGLMESFSIQFIRGFSAWNLDNIIGGSKGVQGMCLPPPPPPI